MLAGVSNGDDLEGKLILIAGDSPVSRGFRDDMYKHLSEDHQFGTRIVRLDSEVIEYSNHKLNFKITSPDADLSMDDIERMLRTGDSYFVSKLENPVQEDPLRYHLDQLVDTIGGKYAQLASTSGLSDEDRRRRFFSYTATNFGKILRDVVDEEVLETKLWEINRQLYELCGSFEDSLQYLNSDSDDVPDQVATNLRTFKFAMKGYLVDLVPKQPQIIAEEEMKSVSHRIGTEIIQPGDTGRLSWITPFLDLRSDHNEGDPHEGIRVKELASHAQTYGVRRITMLRGHSQRGIDHFTNNGIKVEDLTQTNEYISMLAQSIDNFEDFYVLAPDKGALADAMVFARELYRRTKGKFSGRVVVLDKERAGIGEIKGMEFEASYVYDPRKDKGFDDTDSSNKPIPYDHPLAHAKEYKDEGSENYVGKLFRKEFNADKKENLQGRIKGHTALSRDDIIASGGTMLTAAEYAFNEFGSKSILMAEHPCFTGSAIEKLSNAYDKGHIAGVITSNSIVHPNAGERPWHVARSLSRRFATGTRKEYKEFVKENFSDFHNRLEQFDARS